MSTDKEQDPLQVVGEERTPTKIYGLLAFSEKLRDAGFTARESLTGAGGLVRKKFRDDAPHAGLDEVLGRYAQACWKHDQDGMRDGYIALMEAIAKNACQILRDDTQEATRLDENVVAEMAAYELDNWDGDGAFGVSAVVRDNARALLRGLQTAAASRPDVAPSPNGTCTLEWRVDGRLLLAEVGNNTGSVVIRDGESSIHLSAAYLRTKTAGGAA